MEGAGSEPAGRARGGGKRGREEGAGGSGGREAKWRVLGTETLGPEAVARLLAGERFAEPLGCPVGGCSFSAGSAHEFEAHYRARHAHQCSVCRRCFASERLLGLHISEVHDSYFAAMVQRNLPVFECLVEDCEERFVTAKLRQRHLTRKHGFPATYAFDIGVEKRGGGRQGGGRDEEMAEADRDSGDSRGGNFGRQGYWGQRGRRGGRGAFSMT